MSSASSGMTERFSDELRALVKASGRSFRNLAEECTRHGGAVTAPTLRAWADGSSVPTRQKSFEVLAVLEQVLNVQPGMLARHLAPKVGNELPRLAEELSPLFDAALAIRRRWEEEQNPSSTCDLVISTLTLAGPDAEGWVHHRTLVRALHEGVERVVVTVDGTGHSCGQLQTDATIRGGHVRRCTVIEDEIHMMEVIFPRPLRAGEVTAVDLMYPFADRSAAQGRFRALVLVPTKILVATVTAPRHGVPMHFSHHEEHVGGQGPTHSAASAAVLGGSMDSIVRDCTVGLATVQWSHTRPRPVVPPVL